MNNQNLSKQNEISKPKVMQSVNRTCSAGYEGLNAESIDNFIRDKQNKESTIKEGEQTDSSKKPKLSVNANAFIPKNKKLETSTTTTTTTTTTPNEQPKLTNIPQQTYIPKSQYGMPNMMAPQVMMMNNPAYYSKF
jgi:hypothetical protein